MDTSDVTLCPPLQQLKDEHVTLRAEMELFYEITEEIEYDSGPAVIRLFTELSERISVFMESLKAHSEREEKGLFPVMARRLGEKDRTIDSMEFEHEKAEQHLQDFLMETRKAGSTIDEDHARAVAVYAVQAYTTLTQHFAKEEKMLFPLAEQILSIEEKEELGRFLINC
ncbi:hemerythrin domain-containing protein [Ammoniphilus resinae]|uniref:Hemerythrin-like domain-containing protein n=1 Tax=Ammoniphilus resinae TaxID=861532 RepID=A0ABS4GKW4_9BACL|nr:hemerythrin domain-containing protein [Ammoniphilus resinae]MBP1930900.1 hemerythrin-like domain-containing protein [Ammoniphilus resinae]